ncbi:MAG TPA: ABC transporter substrate-binding protein [Pyrinomonadaceae bacterium]
MKRIFQILVLTLFLNLFCSTVPAQNKSVNQSRETLKVGVFLDLTDATAAFGIATRNGILLALEEFNQTGSKKIELLFEDDKARPEIARAAVEKLINEDKVHAILGEVASTNSLAAAPVAQKAKIPMISTASTNPKVTQVGDYIFRACFIDPLQGEAMARFAVQTLSARRAAIIYDASSDYSKSLVATFNRTFTALGGKIVRTDSYAQRDQNFKAQLTAIRRAKPDVIYVSGYYGEAGVIVKQARGLRMYLPMLGGDGWDSPELFSLGRNALRNTFITSHFAADSSLVEARNFTAKYEARYKTKPDLLAALGYDALNLLIDAWRRAGTTNGEKLRNAIAETKDFAGVTGKITFDRSRDPVKQVVVLRTDAANKTFRYQETILPKQ